MRAVRRKFPLPELVQEGRLTRQNLALRKNLRKYQCVDETLKEMVCDVLGLDAFSEESMDTALEKITVDGATIYFHLHDGSVVKREYVKPKRKGTKHTEKFKEHMRQIMKTKWEEGKMHGTKKSDNHSGHDQPVHGSAD